MNYGNLKKYCENKSGFLLKIIIMKKKILICITIISVFSFNCFAQVVHQVDTSNKKAIENQTNTVTKAIASSVKTVKMYHVVETVNLQFGGHTTTYDVPDPKLINTYDLGPNNTRVITILYNAVEQKTEVVAPSYTKVEPINTIETKKIDSFNSKITIDSPKKIGDYAYIDVIKTYERVTDKGYKSIDMLKKVCNAYFFSDELVKAAKCYGELFSLTTDLEPEYYYRYSISLKAIGEDQKASEILKKFNQLSGNQTK
jgi:tetratricopeptide (TPR) repeat protein